MLANNGGPTRTHALGALSPAIDGGPAACLEDNGSEIVVDQRGEPRPDTGNLCDVGAFELQP